MKRVLMGIRKNGEKQTNKRTMSKQHSVLILLVR